MMKENPDISAIAFVLRKIAADLAAADAQSEQASKEYAPDNQPTNAAFRLGYLRYACNASADLIHLCADWLDKREEEDAQ